MIVLLVESNPGETVQPYSLFISFRGRIKRSTFFYCMTIVWASFFGAFILTDALLGYEATLALYPLLFWSNFAVAAKRYHDLGRSSRWLGLAVVPIAGPIAVFCELLFRPGRTAVNRHGVALEDEALAYQTNDQSDEIIDDVTKINPVRVKRVIRPESIESLATLIKGSSQPLSIGGGRFSMGGQTASPNTVHIDMRRLNQVLTFSPEEKWIRVQAGIRWCDIQSFIDPHGLSVKIMQTYANFTVGGSLSVNCHGRYVGFGPLILSVRSVKLLLADGTLLVASPRENRELFYGAIGGYGAIGIIVEAELQLDRNLPVQRHSRRLRVTSYLEHFDRTVRRNAAAVFHNGDIYPPRYERVNAVTWIATDEAINFPGRLLPIRRRYPIHRLFMWVFSETFFGKAYREYLLDPLLFLFPNVRWRNREAGYDVAELEPVSRKHSTYVLQEYFVPIEHFGEFVYVMGEIFRRHRVNIINVSIRHAMPDPGALLAWAVKEVFAFVVYYKQDVTPDARTRVEVWTRELIEAVLSLNGTYYLPYQPHGTHRQFHRAYPRAKELFALKQRLDPQYRLRNSLWDKYYLQWSREREDSDARPGRDHSYPCEFGQIVSSNECHDGLYLFLQNVFHLYPESAFHQLIKESAGKFTEDEQTYKDIAAKLATVTPKLQAFRFALPALSKQKSVICHQTVGLIGAVGPINGYVEIGGTGRYVRSLRASLRMRGDVVLVNEVAPAFSLGDILERGGLRPVGRFVPLNDYAPISQQDVATASVDLVTCYIGLHHAPPDRLDAFVGSIRRLLRPGGHFVLRDHDASDDEMRVFVSLVHSVFNLGLGVSWTVNAAERRNFQGLDFWVGLLERHGFQDLGQRLFQERDPSRNALMCFRRED